MKNNVSKILPVLFGFFVMGFCDVVGIANSYAEPSWPQENGAVEQYHYHSGNAASVHQL